VGRTVGVTDKLIVGICVGGRVGSFVTITVGS